MESYSLKELVEKANRELEAKKRLGSISYSDSRVSESLTERRLRDYQTKGIISPPMRTGRQAVYNDSHLNEILKARELSSQGYTDTQIADKKHPEQESDSSAASLLDTVRAMKEEVSEKDKGFQAQSVLRSFQSDKGSRRFFVSKDGTQVIEVIDFEEVDAVEALRKRKTAVVDLTLKGEQR